MELPPIDEIACALRKTTELLAHELGARGEAPRDWSAFDWQIASAASSMHGISALLWGRWRLAGPDSWRQFLEEQREHSVKRHQHIAGVLQAIDVEAKRAGLAVVALKGAALSALGIYAPGERPMGDIDLLVRAEDSAALAGVLGACDYADAFVTRRHQVFQPRVLKPAPARRFGEHVNNTIKIEVHTRIAEPLPVASTDITACLLASEHRAGINPYPSPARLMLHLLLHAAGNMRARALRLIQLHDIALLAARFQPPDWQELLAIRPEDGSLWWAAPPLVLTARYYPAAISPALLAVPELACSWPLARRSRRQSATDVSWSNIHIEAFPGLEWSRSIGEAVQFVKSRVWPSAEARSELKEGAAQIPGSATVPWYGISHPARIARWVLSRPPRVQTLLCVRAALSPDA